MAAGLKPPWSTEDDWREINAAIEAWAARRSRRLRRTAAVAAAIRRQIDGLDPLLEALSQEACTRCRTVCCRTATVWFDFRDLLYHHLAGLPAPPVQILRYPPGPCPHLAPSGCRLDRRVRPFLCTWYVCPDQRRLLAGRLAAVHGPVTRSLDRLRRLRLVMEEAFLEALS